MLQAGTTTFPAKWVKGSVNLAQSGGRRMELSILGKKQDNPKLGSHKDITTTTNPQPTGPTGGVLNTNPKLNTL